MRNALCKHKSVATKKTLKNKCDKLVGEIVRSKGHCEFCGYTETLQCCHIVTRTIVKLRYDLDNLLCLCPRCHRHGHNKPLWFAEKVKEIKGEEIYKYLLKATQVLKPVDIKWYEKKEKELKNKLSTIET